MPVPETTAVRSRRWTVSAVYIPAVFTPWPPEGCRKIRYAAISTAARIASRTHFFRFPGSFSLNEGNRFFAACGVSCVTSCIVSMVILLMSCFPKSYFIIGAPSRIAGAASYSTCMSYPVRREEFPQKPEDFFKRRLSRPGRLPVH